jgi:ketosteroid isomerase-like protein
MSRENVKAFKRAVEAANRRDVEALLEGLDPNVEWHPGVAALLGGEATVYWGHDGVRELWRDLYGAFAEVNTDFPEIRDLGDRIIAIGRIRTRGRGSGAETESPFGYVVDFKNGRATRVLTFLDPKDAFEAAGLSE